MKRGYPMKLALLPGLRWRGKLTVESEQKGGYLVQWDAEETSPKVRDRFIFDRAVLTAKQIKDWTGVEL